MVVVPAPTIVTVFPETVATVGSELANVTVKLELAVALKAKAASVVNLSANAANVTVWLAFVILPVNPVGWVRL